MTPLLDFYIQYLKGYMFGGMQINATIRQHFTPTRMAILVKKKKIKASVVRRCGEIRTLVHGWWDCEVV